MYYSVSLTGGNVLCVGIEGDLIFAAHQAFKPVIPLIENTAQTRVVIDLSQAGRVDLAGIGMLLIARDRADETGKEFELFHAPDELAQALRCTRLGRRLEAAIIEPQFAAAA